MLIIISIVETTESAILINVLYVNKQEVCAPSCDKKKLDLLSN
jgi:hypothetical protein